MQLYAQAIFRQLLGLPNYITTKKELKLIKMASAERYAADGVLIGLTDMRMRQRQWHEQQAYRDSPVNIAREL